MCMLLKLNLVPRASRLKIRMRSRYDTDKVVKDHIILQKRNCFAVSFNLSYFLVRLISPSSKTSATSISLHLSSESSAFLFFLFLNTSMKNIKTS